MLKTSNLAVLLILFLLFPFLAFTKCQILNLRVSRSRDQVQQRAYWPNKGTRLEAGEFFVNSSRHQWVPIFLVGKLLFFLLIIN